MITYQVSCKVQPEAETKWLQWMRTVHVPDVISTGLLRSYQILKSQDNELTYHFHYHFETLSDYETYQQDHSPRLRDDHNQTFGGQVQASREVFSWV